MGGAQPCSDIMGTAIVVEWIERIAGESRPNTVM